MTALGDLIDRHRAGRSFRELADAGGGYLSMPSWHRFATQQLVEEPTDQSIATLAAGLGIPETDVAAAVSEDVYGDDPAAARARIAERKARRERLFAATESGDPEAVAAALAENLAKVRENRGHDDQAVRVQDRVVTALHARGWTGATAPTVEVVRAVADQLGVTHRTVWLAIGPDFGRRPQTSTPPPMTEES